MKNDLLKEERIDLKDLLLDPNNPRFLKHHAQHVNDGFDLKKVQEDTFDQMNDESNHFEIPELMNAIKADGFIPVDKIFVKKYKDKYLVIEGNRRVTAIMRLIRETENSKTTAGSLDKSLIEEIKKPSCVIINVDDEKAENTVRKILGLRHHGSILPWKPLPAAYNLYQEYMNLYGSSNKVDPHNPENFNYEPTISKKVAAMYSVKLGQVRDQIKVFRVYLQLLDASHNSPRVQSPDSFSMIQETLSKKSLTQFFGYDESKSTFSDEGVEKILDLYYGLRDKPAVITQASAGDSNVRDFAYIVESKNESAVTRLIEERAKAIDIKSEIKVNLSERSLQAALESIFIALDKIRLGDIELTGFAPVEKDYIDKIDKKMSRLKRAAGLKDS